MIAARQIVLRHNTRTLIDHATMGLAAGDRVGLVGRNGSGKSTFLKILVGEIPPDDGEVIRQRDTVLGYLPQDFALDPDLDVESNVQIGRAHV